MQALADSRHIIPCWAWEPSDAAPACVDGEQNEEEDFWRLTYSSERERAIDCKIDVAEIKEGEEEEHESLFNGRLKSAGIPTSVLFGHRSYLEISDSGSGSFHSAFLTTSRRYLIFRVFRI